MTNIHVPENYDYDEPSFERLRSKRVVRHRKREGERTAARKRRKATRSMHKDIRSAVVAARERGSTPAKPEK